MEYTQNDLRKAVALLGSMRSPEFPKRLAELAESFDDKDYLIELGWELRIMCRRAGGDENSLKEALVEFGAWPTGVEEMFATPLPIRIQRYGQPDLHVGKGMTFNPDGVHITDFKGMCARCDSKEQVEIYLEHWEEVEALIAALKEILEVPVEAVPSAESSWVGHIGSHLGSHLAEVFMEPPHESGDLITALAERDQARGEARGWRVAAFQQCAERGISPANYYHGIGRTMLSWETDTKQAEEAIPRRIACEDAEHQRLLKQLEETQKLVVQAYREWTPTQGPTDKWVAQAKEIKESLES